MEVTRVLGADYALISWRYTYGSVDAEFGLADWLEKEHPEVPVVARQDLFRFWNYSLSIRALFSTLTANFYALDPRALWLQIFR